LCFETANHHESLNLVEASIEMTGSGISYAIMGMGPGGDWPRLHAPMLEQSIVYTTLHSEYKLSEKGLINVKDARDAWALLEY
jgi:3-dehydroquinate dehydratase